MTLPSPLETHLLAQEEPIKNFFWHRIRNRVVLNALPKKTEISIVDVGAGAGVFGDYLREVRPDCGYFFVEPFESLNSNLRTKFGPQFDAKNRDFRNFSAVVLLDVLEHQKDDSAFLGQVIDKSKSGTTFVVTVPAMGALWSEWDVKMGHFRRYNKNTLRKTLNNRKVKIREISYLFPELVLPGLLRKRTLRKEDSSEFPRLSKVVNSTLYWLARVTSGLRRFSPFGSSLLLVFVKE